MALPALDISIVIPTRNEADCVRPLLARLGSVLDGLRAEVIFVDDSDDRTPGIIREAAFGFRFDLHLIHRPPGARVDGLGGAVVAGIRAAQALWVCVLDADLQHPPEVILDLLKAGRTGEADLIVASRNLSLHDTQALSLARRGLSLFLNHSLRLLFRGALRDLPDPLSGMFAFKRSTIDINRLDPHGYKILLDILIRHPELRVRSLQFEFQRRHAGESKADLLEGLRFLRLLAGIWIAYNLTFVRFLLVGLSGLLVNSALLALFVESGNLHYLFGAGLATQGSTLWNFLWTEGWVFPNGRNRRTGLQRLGVFFLMNNLLLLVRAPVLALFVDGLDINYLVSNVLSIGLLALARFVVSEGWIWEKADGHGAREKYFYDIHGIAGITSTVPLPELAHFRVSEPPALADLRVITVPKKSLQPDPEAVSYDEGFADAGFWLRIRTGEQTVVHASPLLERSPHVLYTNVVEPILRWTLVCKGYALVHGACISYQGKALLISAATDTGKTTTVLKSLSTYPFDFLGDDMVILGSDGRLLSYPKPLTISLHTLKAVPAAQLSLGERIRLQIQSRIHSRLGRRIGILFGNIRLPAATLNAYLQMLVPPPKFAIERLIPGVSRVTSARLAYLVVIERGPVKENILPKNRVYPILARNIDDAYGFPPYPYIAEALSRRGTDDLREHEKELISRSIQNLPAVNLHRDDYAWWQRLPAVYHGELFGVPDPISSRYPTTPRQAVIDPGR